MALKVAAVVFGVKAKCLLAGKYRAKGDGVCGVIKPGM
jgi:hypothetical protein